MLAELPVLHWWRMESRYSDMRRMGRNNIQHYFLFPGVKVFTKRPGSQLLNTNKYRSASELRHDWKTAIEETATAIYLVRLVADEA